VIKVKNVRPGLLLIADAGLKLAPGETASVEKLTGQMNRCIEDGLLTRVEPELEAKLRPRSPERSTESKQEPGPAESESVGTDGADMNSVQALAGEKKPPEPPAKNTGVRSGSS